METYNWPTCTAPLMPGTCTFRDSAIFVKTKLRSIFWKIKFRFWKLTIFHSKLSIFDTKMNLCGLFWRSEIVGRGQMSISVPKIHCNIHVKFFGNRSNFEVLFMELIWHISGELIMYKILRGRWIWSVCFAPPFNVLLSKMRNGSEFVYSATLERIIFLSPFLLSSAGRTVVEDEHLAPNEHQNSTSTVGTHKRTSTWISRTPYIDLKVCNQNSIYNTSKHVIIF